MRYGDGAMKKEAKLIQEKKLRDAMRHIENDMRLSFHHYSIELNIPVQVLQEEWAKYNHEKRTSK